MSDEAAEARCRRPGMDAAPRPEVGRAVPTLAGAQRARVPTVAQAQEVSRRAVPALPRANLRARPAHDALPPPRLRAILPDLLEQPRAGLGVDARRRRRDGERESEQSGQSDDRREPKHACARELQPISPLLGLCRPATRQRGRVGPASAAAAEDARSRCSLPGSGLRYTWGLMLWFTLWFMVILKIPALYLCYVIWWAVKDPPVEAAGGASGGLGGGSVRPGPHRPRTPVPGRRPGPHGP